MTLLHLTQELFVEIFIYKYISHSFKKKETNFAIVLKEIVKYRNVLYKFSNNAH